MLAGCPPVACPGGGHESQHGCFSCVNLSASQLKALLWFLLS